MSTLWEIAEGQWPRGDESWRELPDPREPSYVVDAIVHRLDGEDDLDCGLFFLAEAEGSEIKVRVMTEDANRREYEVAAYTVTVTKVTP